MGLCIPEGTLARSLPTVESLGKGRGPGEEYPFSRKGIPPPVLSHLLLGFRLGVSLRSGLVVGLRGGGDGFQLDGREGHLGLVHFGDHVLGHIGLGIEREEASAFMMTE